MIPIKDVFFHASEDKDAFVRPLAENLRQYGVDVWYDEYELKLGNSISASITKGLIECRFGLVVLRPAFLRKNRTSFAC